MPRREVRKGASTVTRAATRRRCSIRGYLLGAVAALCFCVPATLAQAREQARLAADIPTQPLAEALAGLAHCRFDRVRLIALEQRTYLSIA